MRVEWAELPVPVRAAVEARTGPVASAAPVPAGTMSPVAVRLRTATGDLFVKGVRAADERAVWMCGNEATLGPLLPGVALPVRLLIEADGWVLLGTEWMAGRPADLMPGSVDLSVVAEAVARIATVGTPCPCRFLTLAQRWKLPDQSAFVGDTLVHADLCAENFLIADDGRVRVIDFAWPARGPAWADTAMLIPRLIRAGHTPADAEEWAATVPAWRSAGPEDVTAFAVGRAEVMARYGNPRPEIAALTAATIAWRDSRV